MGLLSSFLASKKLLPTISATERIALEAGTSWLEADIFNGEINWSKVFKHRYCELTPEEQAFVDDQTEHLCHLVNDWQVQQTRKMPDAAIKYIHEQRFLGLMIPKSAGGHGFSNQAFSAILQKLASRNAYLCLYVLIPNSVGPAELIETYGTAAQKQAYLPKLACGDFIPCFALTEPTAGSDAVSIKATGEIIQQEGDLFIQLNFEKRYISMAPVANLIGLAFNLFDPNNLLGKGSDLGITCALVHKETEGVSMGQYHDPNGSVFPNGPIYGKNVVIPVDNIIGGIDGAGRGWQMLMEALSGGRAISLPAQATGLAKQVLRTAVSYSALRQQFKVPISRFEGVEEVLMRMLCNSYSMDAMRCFICSAVDMGEKPAVASALVKYQHTELCRQTILDGMDVLAGKAIMRGPRAIMGDMYRSAPIGVTVEGANILTRTLIQFGQGAIRCHPYVQKELNALLEGRDGTLIWLATKHLGRLVKNILKLSVHSLTRGLFIRGQGKSCKRLQQKISWASARFAVISDLALLTNGPNLKKRGALSGRLGDCMGYLLYAIAVLRRYEAQSSPVEAEVKLVTWCVEDWLNKFDHAMDDVLVNFDVPGTRLLTRYLWRFSSRINPVAHYGFNRRGKAVMRSLQKNPDAMSRLTAGLYQPSPSDNDAQSALTTAMQLHEQAQSIIQRYASDYPILTAQGFNLDYLTQVLPDVPLLDKERSLLLEYAHHLAIVIGVDEFSPDDYHQHAAPGL